MQNEKWVPVSGFDGIYSISNLGRVRSEERTVKNNMHGGERIVRARVLKSRPDGSGHLYVHLYKNQVRMPAKIASLVAAAFIGIRPPGLETCHNDGNKNN